MTTTFRRDEMPITFSMMMANKMRPRRDGYELFQQYFMVWTAFNTIYTANAHRKGCRTRLKRDADNEVVTVANGNVRIPQVVRQAKGSKFGTRLRNWTMT